MKIAACLIVKNSEQTLEACLASIRPYVDEINIYDTGSTDGTMAVLERLSANQWISARDGESPLTFREKDAARIHAGETGTFGPLAPIVIQQGEWRDDFAWAREQSFAMCSDDVDWILWLDDDDEIVGAPNLRPIAAGAAPDTDAFVFLYDYARDQAGQCLCQLWRERLVRRTAGLEWKGAVHEVLVPPAGRTPNYVTIPPQHVRYVHNRPAGRYAPDRNLRILMAEHEAHQAKGEPTPPRTLAYIGTELMSQGQFGDATRFLDAYLSHPEATWPDERAQVHHKLATAFLATGSPHAAVEAEMRALRERDDWAENAIGLAQAFAATGRWDRALRWARRGLELGMPQSPLILNPMEHHLLPLVTIADACMHLGDFDGARAAIQQAAQVSPIPEVVAKAQQIEQAAGEAELLGAILMLRETLVRHDENAKAWQLLQAVPYMVADHPAIVKARIDQREMVAHMLRPDEYERWYRDEPKESTVEDEYVETIDEYIHRARFLREGLERQEQELGRKPLHLDLGANDSWMACFLWKSIGVTVDGVELNTAAYEKGLARLARFGAPGKLVQGNLHDAPSLVGERQYDSVSLFEVLEHVPDVEATLDVLERLVRPGGRIYITTPNGAYERGQIQAWDKVQRKGHLWAITAHELSDRLLKRGDIVDLRTHADDRLTFVGYQPSARKGSVVFFAGESWEPWSPTSLKQGGIGGSETALVQVACRLARDGYAVKVYSGATPGFYAGVLFRPASAWDPGEECDLFVSSRRPDVFDLPINARRTALWCHDHSYPGQITDERAARIDEVIVLSEWERDRFARLHPNTAGKLLIIRNGITVTESDGSPRYPHADRGYHERHPRAIYSSSADRGLDVLLDLWPRIREAVPSAELHVFYGFNTLDRVALANPALQAFKTSILQKVASLGGEDAGIVLRGRVGQVELADEMQQARVLAYPTAFLETSCITAMEARAAGLPIVTSAVGALTETVGGHGILLPWADDETEPHNRTQAYQDAFVDHVIEMLASGVAWQEAHNRALQGADTLDWQHRAREWADLVPARATATPANRAARRARLARSAA